MVANLHYQLSCLNQNYHDVLPTDAAPQFLQKLTPLFDICIIFLWLSLLAIETLKQVCVKHSELTESHKNRKKKSGRSVILLRQNTVMRLHFQIPLIHTNYQRIKIPLQLLKHISVKHFRKIKVSFDNDYHWKIRTDTLFQFFMLERGSSKLASSKQRCYQPSDFCRRQHYWLPIYVFNGSIKLITGLLKRRRFVVAKIKAARFPHSLILQWIYSSMQNWSYTGKLRFQDLVQQVIA